MILDLPRDIVEIIISSIEVTEHNYKNYLLISRSFLEYFLLYGNIQKILKNIISIYKGSLIG